MMQRMRSWREAAERFDERRRREHLAPRLESRSRDLASLRLAIEEFHDGTRTGSVKHVRHVVVASAPALFALPCGDASCEGGGYDVTRPVMRALRGHTERFEADARCAGTTGGVPCRRMLHVVGTATYRP
jgi:hypothetical protein